MRVSVSAIVLGLIPPAATAAEDTGSPTLGLMPVPAQMEKGVGVFELDPDFAVTLEGEGATGRLERAVRRMLRRLADRSTLCLADDAFLKLENREAAPMTITVERAGELVLGENESYRLVVNEESVHLQAATDIGALRGLQTFLQLVALEERGVTVPVVEIVDEPRFPWRGLMIDSSRHFMPIDMIKRNLDGMAAVKLNVLHWHLVDDQGFRVECLALPKLHQLGLDGDYYSRAQIRELLDYAADRGIRVVPEFDLPGHGTAWLTAYPELGSAPRDPTRSSAAGESSTPPSIRSSRRPTPSSTPFSPRWPICSTTSSSTSAVTRTTASTGWRIRRSSPS